MIRVFKPSLLLLGCLFYAIPCRAKYKSVSFPFVKPQSCNEAQFFDSVQLSCRECGGEDGDQRSFQRGSPDGLSCDCKVHHKLVTGDSVGVKCQPCAVDEVTSFDGWKCIKCPTKDVRNDTEACLPCDNGILVEKLENSVLKQECLDCPSSTWPDPSINRCVRCPLDFQLASDGNCTCPPVKYVISGGSCIPVAKLLPANGAWSTVTYEDELQLKSVFFQEHLQAVIYNCQVIKNITACQVLANLCVLSHYKTDSDSDDSTACDKYLEMTKGELGLVNQWPENMPWLYYLEETAKAELYKTNVYNRFAFHSGKNLSKINLAAASYTLNGTFLGIFPITASKIEPCGGVSEEMESGFVFGVQFSHECKLKVRNMWDRSKLVFYELFLINNNEDGQQLYPIPVLNKKLNRKGQFVNRDSDKSNWQLTRRFFLFDPVTGIKYDQDVDSDNFAKVFRYANHISIRITVRDDEDSVGNIFPPLLILDYGEVTSDDYKLNAIVNSYFSISYEMSQNQTFTNISISLGIISVLSLFWTVFQTWGWAKRSGKRNIDIMTIGRLLIFACGSLANSFLLVILCASINWLVMFKCQSVVHLLLPTPEQANSIMLFISLAFVMKGVQLLDMLLQQCSTNIFFIDWERPRSKTAINNRRTSMKITDETNLAESVSNTTGSLSGGLGGAISRASLIEKNNEILSASIWRVYFVASTWTELQTLRRASPSLQLFCVLLFLNVIGFETLTIADPFSNFQREDYQRYTPYSIVCRFAIGASIYLLIAFLQLAIHRVIYERFFEDKLQQFVDLCSVSNVSVFVKTMVKYGFYIHGRSTHGRADINMKEMHEHLRREEEDLCGHRGLLPSSEQQTFQMSLPEGLHEQYQRLLQPLRTYSQTSDRMQGAGGRLSKVDIDRVVNTYLMMNKFLSGYIEHAFKDLDYVIRDRLLFEDILDVEFADVADRGIFYNDNGHSFDRALFCGQESALIIFEVLLFTVVDSKAQNYITAAVITYFTSRVLQAIRKSVGRRNLVRKALIDERFLC